MEARRNVQRRERHGHGLVSGNRELHDLAGRGHPARCPAARVDPVGDVEVVEPQAA